MNETLKSLHSVVGVDGTFLTDYDGNLVTHTCPDRFNLDAIAKIGYAFSLGLRVARLQNRLPKAIFGTYDQGRVTVRPFDKGLIVVMGDIATKQLLLKAALDRVVEKLEETKIAPKPVAVEGSSKLQIVTEKVRVDQAELDAGLVSSWEKLGKGKNSISQVEIQTEQGKIAIFRVKTKKGYEEKVGLNNSAIKELKVAEGETVTVRPVIRLSSEVEDFFG